MNVIKMIKSSVVIATFALIVAVMSGCGGVSEAQLAELRDLRSEVSSLESEANSLKQERNRLEKEIAEKNSKLQQCERDKEQTRANLEKLPK